MNKLISPYQKDEALIAEMDSLLGDQGRFHLWWLGQSGFLLQWNGKRVLLDPYLSDSLTRKYQDTDKPHVRMSEMVCSPDLLRHINIVTSSHNHTDHLDAETLLPIIQNNPGIKLLIPAANREFVADRLKCDLNFPRGLADGESMSMNGFTFHGIPAKHNELERDEEGRCRYMGYIVEFGDYKIYHSGDTLLDDEIVNAVRSFKVDLAILPVNGNSPERRVPGNLNAQEAVKLAKAVAARMAIPCHYDMFFFNTADVEDFRKEATKAGQPFQILQLGQKFSGHA